MTGVKVEPVGLALRAFSIWDLGCFMTWIWLEIAFCCLHEIMKTSTQSSEKIGSLVADHDQLEGGEGIITHWNVETMMDKVSLWLRIEAIGLVAVAELEDASAEYPA